MATEFFYRHHDYDRLMELYLEGVNFFMRHRFEPFLERLLAIAEALNSLVVVFGDHGEEYDEESRGHYDSVNEGVVRTPMILYGFGIEPLQTDEIVRSIDLAPTLYDLQGWPNPVQTDGRSLAEMLHSRSVVRETERIAFAQTYVSDVREFLDVQKRTIAGETGPIHLRHVLYKERAWRGRDRVTRQFHAYEDRLAFRNLGPIEPVDESASLDADGCYRPSEAPNAELLASLTAYNRGRRRASAAQSSATAEVRQHLRAMGYKL
jgi:arylsulfatase A-like enzyme